MSGSTTDGSGNTTTALDPQVKADWTNVFNQAQGVSNTLNKQAVPTQSIAGLTTDQTAANNLLNSNLGTGNLAVTQGANAAYDASNYKPDQVDPNQIGHADNANAVNAKAADLGNATTYDPTLAKSTGYDATNANAQGYNATNAQATSYDPSTIGHAATYNAQNIDASKVGKVDPSTLAGTNLNPYLDPGQQDLVNATIADSQHNLKLNQQSDKAAAIAANAFGGSREGVQRANTESDNSRNLNTELAGLNQANFTQAQAAAQSDINRGLQAQTTNQATGLAIQSADQGAQNQASATNTAAQNQVKQLNQSALNTAGQFGAAAQNTADLTNAGAANTADQFTSAAKNAASSQNAQAANTADQFGAAAANTAGLTNASAANTAGQFNAGSQNTFDQQSAADTQQANLANAAANTQTNQFNAAQSDAIKQANQQAGLAADTSNQSAGLNANQQAISASGLLGQLGGQQQQMGLNDVNALNTQGTALQQQAQNVLNTTYANQEAQRNASTQALQVAESPFQVIPSTSSGGTSATNSSGKGLAI